MTIKLDTQTINNYAHCEICFYNSDALDSVIISLDAWDGKSNDDSIFYYCDTVKDLKALVGDVECNNSDFYIIKIRELFLDSKEVPTEEI